MRWLSRAFGGDARAPRDLDAALREALKRIAAQQSSSQTTTLGDLIADKLARKSEGGR